MNHVTEPAAHHLLRQKDSELPMRILIAEANTGLVEIDRAD